MRRLDYQVTARIWLHLEDYYNDGLEPERARELIESLQDPSIPDWGMGTRFYCRPMGINNNWIVEIRGMGELQVQKAVRVIQQALESEMHVIGMKKAFDQVES